MEHTIFVIYVKISLMIFIVKHLEFTFSLIFLKFVINLKIVLIECINLIIV